MIFSNPGYGPDALPVTQSNYQQKFHRPHDFICHRFLRDRSLLPLCWFTNAITQSEYTSTVDYHLMNYTHIDLNHALKDEMTSRN